MEGFYALYYTGVSGFGHAVLVLRGGVICGADATGGVYDGKYDTVGDETEAEVTLTVPAGATLVTGQILTSPLSQKISAKLGKSFADGQPVPIHTPMGPVNVIFKKLRQLS